MTQKRILFVGEGVTLSHIIRPLVLAKSLEPELYDIIFACESRYRQMIEKEKLKWKKLSSMPTDEFNRKLATGEPLYTYRRLKDYLEAEKDLFQELKPDFVVGDFRISLAISSRIHEITYICLVNAYWSPFKKSKHNPPIPELPITKLVGLEAAELVYRLFMPLGFYLHRKDFNKLCVENGQPPADSLYDMYSRGTWTLYPDTPQIAPTEQLPKNHFYVGPICEIPNLTLPSWWGTWPKNKPLIYLSLGSSGDISLFDVIYKTLAGMDVSVILTTSGLIKENILAKNFFVTDYVSGSEAAKIAQLFITNGGSGAVYQGLTQGVPILGFPTNLDQFFVMEQVQRLGAGDYIRPSLVNEHRIRQMIDRLLQDEQFRLSVKNIAQEIQQYDAGKTFRNFMKDLSKNQI